MNRVTFFFCKRKHMTTIHETTRITHTRKTGCVRSRVFKKIVENWCTRAHTNKVFVCGSCVHVCVCMFVCVGESFSRLTFAVRAMQRILRASKVFNLFSWVQQLLLGKMQEWRAVFLHSAHIAIGELLKRSACWVYCFFARQGQVAVWNLLKIVWLCTK